MSNNSFNARWVKALFIAAALVLIGTGYSFINKNFEKKTITIVDSTLLGGSMKLQPFTINIPQAKLDDLKTRLQNTKWPEGVKDTAWAFGTDLSYMQELVKYWASKYDWKKQEAELNKLPQYTAEVDGVKIHFFHIRSNKPKAKAIFLTHGWPDSFYRFHKVIPILSEEYDVVVPSIPGLDSQTRIQWTPPRLQIYGQS